MDASLDTLLEIRNLTNLGQSSNAPKTQYKTQSTNKQPVREMTRIKSPIKTPTVRSLKAVKPNKNEKKQLKIEIKELNTNFKNDTAQEKPISPNYMDVLPQIPDELLKKREKTTHRTKHTYLSGKRKQFLFLKISDTKILEYITGGTSKWTNLFKDNLTIKNSRAYFDGLPILYKSERKKKIKTTYFDPSKPTSQFAIYQYLLENYANITRKEVVRTLHSLELYQRMQTRSHPKKITGRIDVTAPGFLCADTIYPSKKNGFNKTVVFTVMDMWSRYGAAYIVTDKRASTIKKAFELFVDTFIQISGVMPKKLFIDQGSELMMLDSTLEKYCKKSPCVFRSLTAMPVHAIEGYNAILQRKIQIYKEANIISQFKDCLWLVTNSMNNEPVKDKMGYTPIQLLNLPPSMRAEVNNNYKYRNIMPAEKNPLQIGDYCRVLLLDRKAQLDSKTKGFPMHWSKNIYIVVRTVHVIKNPGVNKYHLEDILTKERLQGGRFRHEILKIKAPIEELDKRIPNINVKPVDKKLYMVEGTGDDSLYNPNE